MSVTDGSTSRVTMRIVPGVARDGGWTELALAPVEQHVGGLPDGEMRPLSTMLHSSDWHICDHESPARQEYMDRYFDPDSEFQAVLGYIGTYRAHEAFTTQVAAAMLGALNAVVEGPMLGRKVDAVVITGDVTDNGQLNELEWYIDLLDGRKINPSGGRATSEWVGAAQGAGRDERYWHPEGGTADLPRLRFGFPEIPGLIEAARKPFVSPGSVHPWLTVHGNHDALLQGTVAPTTELNALATGGERITGLAPNQEPTAIAGAIPQIGPAAYIHTDSSPREMVTPDSRRRLTEPGKFAEVHLQSTSMPKGHGFTEANVASKTAYYSYVVGEVLLVAMDSVNVHGGYEGSLDLAQLDWVVDQARAHRDKHVVLASHHPSRAMVNNYAPSTAPRRVLGDEVLRAVLAETNIVAWINGHEHEHQLILNVGSGGRILPEINTASVVDWPQQSRILEFATHPASRTIYVASTIVDHSGHLAPDRSRLDVLDIAGISRLLAFNDYQRREPFANIRRKEGSPADRNFVLRLPDPLARDGSLSAR